MHRCSMSPRLRRQSKEDEGFTLIELLVVITILGILAAVVVFAVRGIGDKGKSASISTDATVLKTAEEAYCAQHGSYTDAGTLLSAKLLASAPSYNSIVLTKGSCGTAPATPTTNSGFVLGSPSSVPATGELVLAASNNTPGFSFLSSSAPSPVKFTFDKSSNLANTADAVGPAVLFASADLANVLKTFTSAGSIVDPTTGASRQGTCSAAGAIVCDGDVSTARLYAIGRLVGFSCKSGGKTLAPATNAPNCTPPGGVFPAASADMADLVNKLAATPSLKLAIPDPGTAVSGSVVGANVTCSPAPGSTPSAPTVAASAPYGVAAYQALTTTSAGGGSMSCNTFYAEVCTGQIFGPAATAPVCTAATGGAVTSAVGAGGNNVSQTQDKVVQGSVAYALIPNSFVTSPAGNDTNNHFLVPASVHTPVNQFAIVLRHNEGGGTGTTAAQQDVGKSFLNYVISQQGQDVLGQFVYDPISPLPTQVP